MTTWSEPDDATPLDPDELEGLIPSITTRAELNALEASNIAKARLWASTSRKTKKNLLNTSTLNEIHKRMFDQTWTWAGTFRRSDKNIGVSWFRISGELKKLCRRSFAECEGKAIYVGW